ncbi:DUF3139 domain-containing protein [Paenibacillus chitinolyticus]|uniref:DUF3139 domain-containing protein n=1 Tax=Paenibacillus chitinolyticus TaxID=79263 RepID=UPI0036421BBA
MLKRLLLIGGICLVLIVIVVFSVIRTNEKNLENEFRNYLVKEKKYSENDIAHISSRFGKMPKYGVFVIFKDEPEVTYSYVKKDKWIQLGPSDAEIQSGKKFKHIDDRLQ